MTKGVPRWHHDGCPNCTFLGTMNDWDLYHCTQDGTIPTVIARYSHEGEAYKSGLPALDDPELAEARKRAILLGLETRMPSETK